MSRAILVTGATGRQGGSLIKHLLASPEASKLRIIALTRNSQSSAAIKLQKQGVSIIEGDLNNIPAIFENKSIKGQPLGAIFGLQSPGIRAAATVVERQQGKALIDHAVANNVKLFIYASVDRGGTESEGTATPVAQFSSKNDIEQHLIKNCGEMNWVILRPTTFMENLTPDIQGKTWASAYKHIMKSRPMHLISTSDIGKVAASVFSNSEKYANTAISLVGDKLTFAEADAIFKEKTGKSIPTLSLLPFNAVMLGLKEFKIMFKWFPVDPPGIDAAKCKEEWGLMSWGEWLEKENPFIKTSR
ncbi:putative nucleoside-diphosphate-sugar epimerase [Tothia fuscella]|uniref:Nucleoside-diphosphate-sugar epimerase n=1 Tax=Tothia fuscella TaxID=1048955 RepID=A0A9P4NGW0_9PEZI|nr:putative nucleoside-diphosphate-sugar epimerase [Tothia fuscella]